MITEAWLRVRPRPTSRTGAVVGFGSFPAGVEAVRAIVQAGLAPATCRLADATEAALTGTRAGGEAVLLVGFEAAGGPSEAELAAAVALAEDAGGRLVPEQAGAAAAEVWRGSFRRAPYLREQLVLLGSWSRPSRPRSPGTASTRWSTRSPRPPGPPWPRCVGRAW